MEDPMVAEDGAEREPARGPVMYVKVRGRLYDDNRLAIRFDGPAGRPLAADEDAGLRLWAEIYDSAGRLRLRHPLALRERRLIIIHGRVSQPGHRRVHAHLPLPSDGAEIRFTRDGMVLRSAKVPATPPALNLMREPPERTGGPFTVEWQADVPVRCRLFLTVDGKSWMPLTGWLRGRAVSLDPADLPGGPACRLRLRATDGFRAIERTTAPFAVPVKPCAAMIIAPSDKERMPAAVPVALRGQGWWLEEQRAETAALRWESSVDGPLGAGAVLHAKLSPGPHTITLTVGTGPRVGRATITLVMESS
jgi:hypothetical protein